MSKIKTINNTYDKNAWRYFEDRTKNRSGSYFYNNCIEMPTTLKLLGNVKNKKLLDLGCGPGIYAKKLISKGAKVTGIDQSKEMVAIAKDYVPKASFTTGSVYKLPYKDNSFDVVLSPLMFDHVKDLKKAFKEVERVLKPKGTFIFSVPHPMFENRKELKAGKKTYKVIGSDKEGKQFFGEYFNEGWRTSSWGDNVIYNYHRTMSTLINTLIKSGFTLEEFQDCKATKACNISKEGKRIYRIFSRFPVFISIKAKL